MNEEIEFFVKRDVAILRVNRPQARNALNWTTQEAFAAAVTNASHNSSFRALIITGLVYWLLVYLFNNQ